MAITYRLTKGLPLTNTEIDNNFEYIEDELATKLDSASYTAADVLTKLLTVDVTGSGLNADTLDDLNTSSSDTTGNSVVTRSSGNFSAGTITASLTGNVTGDVTGDVKATNGTTILDNGTDGTNAAFTGRVNNVTLTSASIGFTVAGGTTSKTLTVSNSVTLSGTDSSTISFGAGGTVAYLSHKLSEFAATSSTELRGVISDETGTGSLVFATSPSLTTPSLGVASATSINRLTITQPATSATLTIANGKTFTASNTLTLTGTDSASVAFGAGGTVAYTGATLAQFSATTSSQLAGIISDETGSGALVFGTTPTLTTPAINQPLISYKVSAITADADAVINATDVEFASVIASFTATRTINVSNLTVGRHVTIYIRNTNATARVINIAAGTATTYTAVNLSRSGAASVTSFSAAVTNGTAVVTLFNTGTTIVGSLA